MAGPVEQLTESAREEQNVTRAALHEFQTGLGDNHVGFDVERVLETIDFSPYSLEITPGSKNTALSQDTNWSGRRSSCCHTAWTFSPSAQCPVPGAPRARGCAGTRCSLAATGVHDAHPGRALSATGLQSCASSYWRTSW